MRDAALFQNDLFLADPPPPPPDDQKQDTDTGTKGDRRAGEIKLPQKS